MRTVSHFFSNLSNEVDTKNVNNKSFHLALKYAANYLSLEVNWEDMPNIADLTIDNCYKYQNQIKMTLISADYNVMLSKPQPFLPVLLADQSREKYFILFKQWGRYKLIDVNKDGEYLPLSALSSLNFNMAYFCVPVGLPVKSDFIPLLRSVWPYIKNNVIFVVILGMLISACSLLVPLVSGYVFNHSHSMHRIDQVAAFLSFGFIFIAMAVLAIINDINIKNLNLNLSLYTMPSMWQHILSIPFKTIQRYQSGAFSQQVFDYNASLVGLISTSTSILFSAISLIIYFIYMLCCQWHLALIFSAISIAILSVKLPLMWKNIHYKLHEVSAKAQVAQFNYELLLQMHKIRSGGMELVVYKKWLKCLLGEKIFSEKIFYNELLVTLSDACMPVITMLIIYLALYISPKHLSIISLFQFIICAGLFTTTFGKFSLQLANFFNLLPSLKRFQALSVEPREDYNPGKAMLKSLEGVIEFKQVTFRDNESNNQILQDISMYIPAGKFVGIVGCSGAGKSTLFRLLLGLESLESGIIEIDNRPLSAYNMSDLRKQIGVVMQTTNILPGTIYSNLSSQSGFTHDAAWHLARLVGLDKDIEKMPMKMHTFISDNAGESLSGGQKQKIMIARALASNPRILLLDEATSALDNESQALIFKNLQELEITRVVIAHRHSTLAGADGIYVLNQGKVVDYCNYDSLRSKWCLRPSALA